MTFMEFVAKVEKLRASQTTNEAYRIWYSRQAGEACETLERLVDAAVAELTAPPSEGEFAAAQAVGEGGLDARTCPLLWECPLYSAEKQP